MTVAMKVDMSQTVHSIPSRMNTKNKRKKETQMKRILTAAALVALCTSVSFAAGITNTKHDLSKDSATTGPKASAQTQICIFCHTPHNAVKNVPLWNRNNTAAAGYKLYTSSSTLTQADGGKSVLYSDSISLFCLSCHDGSVAQLGSRVQNQSALGTVVAGSWTGGDANTGTAMLGSDLTNDHPIGFTYPSGGEAGRLETAANAKTKMGASSNIFFKANNGAKVDQMECSSCHMVHDNTNTYFLRSSNAGSALCLACHIK